jgi:hypothetical protein
MKTALFWVITQRVVVIYYRRFVVTYGPIFEITTTRSVITQKVHFSKWVVLSTPVCGRTAALLVRLTLLAILIFPFLYCEDEIN